MLSSKKNPFASIFKTALLLYAVWLLVVLSTAGLVGYVVIHFIAKFW